MRRGAELAVEVCEGDGVTVARDSGALVGITSVEGKTAGIAVEAGLRVGVTLFAATPGTAVGLLAGFTVSPICREQPASKNSAVTAAVKTAKSQVLFPIVFQKNMIYSISEIAKTSLQKVRCGSGRAYYPQRRTQSAICWRE